VSNALGVNLSRVSPEIGASCALSDSITSVTEYPIPVSVGFVLLTVSIMDHLSHASSGMQAFWQIYESN